MDEFEKMASGRLYNPADPKLDAYHLQRMALCQQLNQRFWISKRLNG